MNGAQSVTRQDRIANLRLYRRAALLLCLILLVAVPAAPTAERYVRWENLDAALVPYLQRNGITQVIEAEAAPPEFRAACEKAGIRLVSGSAPPGIELLKDGTWPGLNPWVQMGPAGDEKATAGASSGPWIDANGWLILYHRATSGRPALLAYDPPKDTRLRPGSVELGVAEAAAFGARFAIKFDDRFRRALGEAQPRAVAEWKQVERQLAFSETPVFRGSPAANIAVVADELEPVGEVLNLLARRNLPYVVLRRDRLSAESLTKYRLIIAIGQPPLSRAAPALKARGAPPLVERKGVSEPEAFVTDIGKRMAGRRLYTLEHADTIISYPYTLDDGRLAVHLVNYAIDQLREVRLRVAGKFSRAELFLPERSDSQPLAIKAGQVVIPDMNVSAVVVFGK